VDAMLEQSSARGLETIQATLDSGGDPRQFSRQVVDYLRNLMVIKLEGGKTLELTPEQREQMGKQAEVFNTAHLIKAITAFGEAAMDLKANWFPGLSLELAFTSTLSQNEPSVIVQQTPTPSTAPVLKPVNKPADLKAAKPEESGESADGIVFSLDSLRLHWDQIRSKVSKENVMVGALVNSSELSNIDGNVITISFKSELLRDKMNDEKNLRILKRVLQRMFKQEILVASTVGQGMGGLGSVPGIVPGGLVEKAQQELGAKVTRIEKRKKEND
jgi:DNA polymerase III gamma/tau subunit